MTICEILLEAQAPLPKGIPENPVTMGDFIREYRITHGFTLFEFSMELGFFESTIHKWEKGYTYPSPKNIEKIINYMGYDPRIKKQ